MIVSIMMFSMVSASLNWASLSGLLLFPFGVVGGLLAFVNIYFNLKRRSDALPAVLLKSVFNALQGLGRFFLMPVCGYFLFTEGWRLDSIQQLGVLILVIGLCFEVSFGIAVDYMKWRYRTGRSTGTISVSSQLID